MMSADPDRRLRVALAVIVLAVALESCGTVLKELEQMPDTEAVVVSGVKSALVGEPQVDAAAIRINIVDGQLVLEGYVDSEEESQRSANIARQNSAGLQVINRLEIR